MGVCTKERKGVAAEVLMATPCTKSLGGESRGHKHEGCDRTRLFLFHFLFFAGSGKMSPSFASLSSWLERTRQRRPQATLVSRPRRWRMVAKMSMKVATAAMAVIAATSKGWAAVSPAASPRVFLAGGASRNASHRAHARGPDAITMQRCQRHE